MNPNRPMLISVVQYQDELAAGTMTVFDLLDKAAAFGVAGVEVRRESWPRYRDEIDTLRERAGDRGLMLTYATFSTLFAKDDAARAMLHHDLETAAALGSPLLRIFPGDAPADTHDPAWDAVRQAVEVAQALDVVIALENWGKLPGGLLREIRHVLDNLTLPALKTNIDIGNYATHGENVLDAIEQIGARAVYAHLKDKAGAKSDATTHLGGGSMPLEAILAALNALPQAIAYCFEFVGGGEPDARIERSLAYLRALENK